MVAGIRGRECVCVLLPPRGHLKDWFSFILLLNVLNVHEMRHEGASTHLLVKMHISVGPVWLQSHLDCSYIWDKIRALLAVIVVIILVMGKVRSFTYGKLAWIGKARELFLYRLMSQRALDSIITISTATHFITHFRPSTTDKNVLPAI